MSARPDRRRPAVLAGAVLLVGAAVLVGLASCGVPLDNGPQAITRTTIAATPTELTTTPGPDSVDLQVYFLNDGRLQAVAYPVPGEPTLSDAIGYLLQGVPSDAPADPPLHTAVPPLTKLLSATVVEGVAVIDLSSDMADAIGGVLQKQAFAQLVFTAMAFDPERITAVSFRIAGKPIDAPTDDNNLTEITTDNYQPPLNPK